MIEDEEQPQLLNTIGEYPTEEVGTIEEDIYVIGVESLNGKAGDLTLKSINGEDLVGTGNIALATAAQMQAETQAREQADAAETLARQQADQALQTAVDGKQTQLTDAQLTAVNSGIDSTKVGQIATNATNITTLQNTKQNNLTQTQLNAVNSGIDQSKVAQIETNRQNIATNAGDIDTIESKIPGAATSTNQLTDKNYVDNAIATNTADYISDNGQPFQSLADLEAYSGPLTNNDYAFVVSTDAAGNLLYTRYKYNATQEAWAEEYTIANPTFTSTQWAAIDSGVTANDVSQIGTNKTDIAGLQTSKQDALSQTQLAAVNSGIDAAKVQQIADNATAIAGKQDKLVAGSNIQIAADGKTISATDTTYTAGTGLTLSSNEFSVTEPVPTGFFSDTSATQTGTGTSFAIDGSTATPIARAELDGDASQATYTGKNLCPLDTYDASVECNVNYKADIPAGSYTVSFDLTSFEMGTNTSFNINMQFRDADSTIIIDPAVLKIEASTSLGRKSYNFSLSTASSSLSQNNIRIAATQYNNGARAVITNIQIEAGSTPTAYEPYVGGIPAPNPSYPQTVNVVTGTQTITVSDGGTNSQSYTIDLGSIELYKVGEYQDYIWKDGSTWKIHKETAKAIFDGAASIGQYNSTNNWFYVPYTALSLAGGLNDGATMSDHFIGSTSSYMSQNQSLNGLCATSSSNIFIRNTAYTATADYRTWLASNNTTIYYVLATATDTAITDATLIGQLDALASSTTYSPQTSYATAGTGTNLPVILTVDAFKNNWAGTIAGINYEIDGAEAALDTINNGGNA